MTPAGAGEADPPDGLSLEVVAGNGSGSTLTVGERLVFGRQSDGPGRLADDPELSRTHAQIVLGAGGEYLLEDLASRNGTYVNGGRVQAPVALSPGDIIDLGTTRLVVRATSSPDPVETLVDTRAATVLGSPAITAPPGPQPPPTLESPPTPQPPPPVPELAPPLELRLSIDIARAEAEVALADGGDAVRLRLQDGRWRIVREG